MILNIIRENPSHEFGSLPELYLPNHSVALVSFYAELESPIQDNYMVVSSSLVDRSRINPNQELASFLNLTYYGESRFIYFQPTHLIWYKLQTEMISDSYIKIENLGNVKIKKLHLKLEIEECMGSQNH